MKGKNLVFIMALLIAASMMLGGCGNSAENDGSAGNGGLTKGEWVGLLGEKFGYQDFESTEDFFEDVGSDYDFYDEIQACAEWEILPEEGNFEPDEQAEWEYAMETSVRAIGIEKLNQSDAGIEVSEDNLVDFYTAEIAQVTEDTMKEPLNADTAAQILDYAYDYAMNLSLAERYEYTYQDSVKEVPADAVTLVGDGVTASVNDADSYSAGDIIYVGATDSSAAYALKVESVEGDEITYSSAGMEDVYEELHVTGTFEGQIVNVIPADGVTISTPEENGDETAPSTMTYRRKRDSAATVYQHGKVDAREGLGYTPRTRADDVNLSVGSNAISLNATPFSGASISLDLTDITITTDIDYGLLKGLQKADATVSFHDKIQASYSRSEHASEQVSLGCVDVLLGPTSLTARFSIVVNFGVDGEVSVTYTSAVVGNVNYVKGRGLSKSVNNNDAACDFHAEVTMTAEPAIKADLRCLGVVVTNVKVTSGVIGVAAVDADLLGNQPTCVDVKAWVPLRWAVNEDWCLITAVSDKLKASGTVWDQDSSAIQLHFHWEDGKEVPECTRGEEEVKAAAEEEEGEYFEYEYFDFEEIEFGIIEVASQIFNLQPGETARIGILSVPDGQGTDILSYTVEDESVCSVNGGVITAKAAGTSLVKISMPDGKVSVYVSVIVGEAYEDTSGFREL